MQIQPPAAALFLKYTSHDIGLPKRLIFRRPAPFSPFLTPPASAQHTEFKRKINVLQLDLPKTENIVGDVGEQHHILLELDSSGRIALDGHEISEHEIPSSVENLLREHPDAQLQFAAADGSSMGNFIRILDSLTAAGLDIEQIPVRINPSN